MDPGESQPGDPGRLRARLRDFGFEVPPVQKPPAAGHKNIEREKQLHNAAAAADHKDDVMTQTATQAPETTTTNPAPTPAPAAGGGDVIENAVHSFVNALAAQANEGLKTAGENIECSTGRRVRWGRVKEAGMYAGGATLAVIAVIAVKAAIEQKGVFAPTVEAPLPTL